MLAFAPQGVLGLHPVEGARRTDAATGEMLLFFAVAGRLRHGRLLAFRRAHASCTFFTFLRSRTGVFTAARRESSKRRGAAATRSVENAPLMQFETLPNA